MLEMASQTGFQCQSIAIAMDYLQHSFLRMPFHHCHTTAAD